MPAGVFLVSTVGHVKMLVTIHTAVNVKISLTEVTVNTVSFFQNRIKLLFETKSFLIINSKWINARVFRARTVASASQQTTTPVFFAAVQAVSLEAHANPIHACRTRVKTVVSVCRFRTPLIHAHVRVHIRAKLVHVQQVIMVTHVNLILVSRILVRTMACALLYPTVLIHVHVHPATLEVLVNPIRAYPIHA